MQQSSSYRPPVLKRGNTFRRQPVTTVREPFSYQFPSSPKIRSMNSVSYATLKAEKTGVFQAPQTLREEDYLVADAAVLRLPGILSLPGIMLPVPVPGKNEQSIERPLRCWKNISTCASSMSCQSCQLMWRSCCNPVHIDHQSLHSFYCITSKGQINEECLLCNVESQESLSLAGTSNLVLGRFFGG